MWVFVLPPELLGSCQLLRRFVSEGCWIKCVPLTRKTLEGRCEGVAIHFRPDDSDAGSTHGPFEVGEGFVRSKNCGGSALEDYATTNMASKESFIERCKICNYMEASLSTHRKKIEELEIQDGYPAPGADTPVQPLGPGSEVVPLSKFTFNLNDGGAPTHCRCLPFSKSTSLITITQWNCRGFRARCKWANLRLYLATFESLPAVVALQEPGTGTTLTNYTTFQQDPSSSLRVAGREPFLIVGDFNAPSRLWGYHREEKRGRRLAELASPLGLTLYTDPVHFTRLGNSVTRDTCPDLTFTHNIQHADWLNTDETLGSGHCIITTTIQTRPLSNLQHKPIQLSEVVSDVDNHLLHLWEARHSLLGIAELAQRAAEYAAQLAFSNWVDRCNTAARQISSRNTWRLFRALIDPNQTHEDALEVILRKIFKRALDLPVNTSNQRLLALRMVNIIRELREAHLTNQYMRLSQTELGRRLLARLHSQHTTLMEERVRTPTPRRYALHVCPLPANVTREDHDGRRLARAEALARHYAAVIHETKTVNGLSFRARDITHAEEVAIALATSHPDSKYIITDLRGACRNIEQGWTPYLAYQILQNSSYIGDPGDRYIIWAPAHQGLAGNEAADAAACALSPREVSSSPSKQDADPNPAYTFKDIVSYYQSGHSLYPRPC
ncbi:hypothetical protein HPB47_019567 [Ixodes persulcatus]|uniref:Uncharacterized protein n=1 Tax=Ixodes persulcatus TaxID=34615 RepID=A0AC60QK20_IXOPE|nr:hypothetical protein HPB47_019567 [Ixodes persulcatus]